MSRSVIFLVVLSAVCAAASRRTLPTSIQKCSAKDPQVNKCIIQRANAYIPKIGNGDRKKHIPGIVPFVFEKLTADIGSMHLELINGKVHGLDRSVIKSFNYDREAESFNFTGSTPKFTVNSDYKTNGKILFLPIEGEGQFEMLAEDVEFSVFIQLKNLHKHSKKPAEVISTNFDFTYGDGKFYFGNLFNGNKRLSDPVNNLLKEEHKSIFVEFRPFLNEAINTMLYSLIKSIFDGYDYNDIFAE